MGMPFSRLEGTLAFCKAFFFETWCIGNIIQACLKFATDPSVLQIIVFLKLCISDPINT